MREPVAFDWYSLSAPRDPLSKSKSLSPSKSARKIIGSFFPEMYLSTIPPWFSSFHSYSNSSLNSCENLLALDPGSIDCAAT